MARLLAHRVFGGGLALFTLHPFLRSSNALILLILGVLGASFPDLDAKLGSLHRVVLHNLTAMVLATIGVGVLIYEVPSTPYLSLNPVLDASAFMVGYLSHLVTDMFTGRGVALFYPFKRDRIGFLGLRFDDPYYNAMLVFLGGLLLFASAYLASLWTGPG